MNRNTTIFLHHYNDDQSILIVKIWISYFFIKYSLNLIHVKLYVVGLMELLYKIHIGLTTSYWNSFLSDSVYLIGICAVKRFDKILLFVNITQIIQNDSLI